jgi:hypothetical protein
VVRVGLEDQMLRLGFAVIEVSGDDPILNLQSTWKIYRNYNY